MTQAQDVLYKREILREKELLKKQNLHNKNRKIQHQA